MASAEEIGNFRLIVDEPTEDFYTDGTISDMLDAALGAGYTPAFPARDVWRQKAARYSTLVNMSEGGSSRANSDLFDRALRMAAMYSNLVDAESEAMAPANYTVLSKLTR